MRYRVLFFAILLALTAPPVRSQSGDPIHRIRHIVIIMQENRSFDSYFGTFPGADGIPMRDGQPTVCVPNPRHGNCVAPFHDSADLNGGGPHNANSAVSDIDGGKMDGFIATARAPIPPALRRSKPQLRRRPQRHGLS